MNRHLVSEKVHVNDISKFVSHLKISGYLQVFIMPHKCRGTVHIPPSTAKGNFGWNALTWVFTHDNQ